MKNFDMCSAFQATDGIKESALDKAICRYAIFHMGEGPVGLSDRACFHDL